MRSSNLSGGTFRIAGLIVLFIGGCAAAGATTYNWPLGTGGPGKPDTMNTSFGPRVNYSKWDFHDGIDLPANCGTAIHAVAGGQVVDAGEPGSGLSSRHVVIKVTEPTRDIYVYYLHLDTIDNSVLTAVSKTPHDSVPDNNPIGTVGQNGATYCHLHLEFREGNRDQASSRHPLLYLPYSISDNFTAPGNARFNRQGNGQMAARLLFGADGRCRSSRCRQIDDPRRQR